LTNEEINRFTDKILAKVNVPGVDRNFIHRCLEGIAMLKDDEVENKIRQFMIFL
jgi:hypothetical protein